MPSALLDDIRGLADLHGLAVAPDLDRLPERLAGPLSRYQELELRSDGSRVDLITLHDDPRELTPFFELLEQRGVPVRGSQAVSLARFGIGHTIGMKLPVAGGLGGGELYVRGPIPLSEARWFLARQGHDSASLERMESFAAPLGKSHTHILAADISDTPSFACYVTTWLEEGRCSNTAVQDALTAAGLPGPALDVAMGLHDALGARRPETLFLSTRLKKGHATPAVKLDYPGVRLGTIMEIMAGQGWNDAIGSAMEWGRLLNTLETSFAGFIYGEAGLGDIRAYFTRHDG